MNSNIVYTASTNNIRTSESRNGYKVFWSFLLRVQDFKRERGPRENS